MTAPRFSALVLACLGALACDHSGGGDTPAAPHPGIVAEVAGDRIELTTVERVALARNLAASSALESVVADAVLAAAARERLRLPMTRAVERAVHARVILDLLWAEAQKNGPPTDEELRVATERRWWELDRPPLVRTTHAVVLTKPPVDDAAARALAERIAAAVASATDAAAFRRAADAVPRGALQVRLEDLEPVAADGRAVNPASPPAPGSSTGSYAAAYAAAAHAIRAIGEKSPVVRSSFGYHVILAVERIPELRMPREERVALLEGEIRERRASVLRDDLLTEGRKRHPVELDRAAADLTERIQVAR